MSTRLLFEWDPAKARLNAAKHGLTFEQAMGVFHDPLALSVLDNGTTDEERWISIGLAGAAGLVLVVHTYTEIDDETAAVRIISARRPTSNERRQYEHERQ